MFILGQFLRFGKCAGVKYLTNIMSVAYLPASLARQTQGDLLSSLEQLKKGLDHNTKLTNQQKVGCKSCFKSAEEREKIYCLETIKFS